MFKEPKPGDKPKVPPKNYEVEQGEWVVVEKGGYGETSGLGPCIGIIVYDSKSQIALLGHFADPFLLRSEFEQMLQKAGELLKNKSKIKVYIGGGAPDLDDIEGSKKTRKFVEDEVKKRGYVDIYTQYQDSTQNTALSIDTQTGKVAYDTEDDWEN